MPTYIRLIVTLSLILQTAPTAAVESVTAALRVATTSLNVDEALSRKIYGPLLRVLAESGFHAVELSQVNGSREVMAAVPSYEFDIVLVPSSVAESIVANYDYAYLWRLQANSENSLGIYAATEASLTTLNDEKVLVANPLDGSAAVVRRYLMQQYQLRDRVDYIFAERGSYNRVYQALITGEARFAIFPSTLVEGAETLGMDSARLHRVGEVREQQQRSYYLLNKRSPHYNAIVDSGLCLRYSDEKYRGELGRKIKLQVQCLYDAE